MSDQLNCTYLGLQLKNPLIVGASPLADDPDMAVRLEDAGASALILHSLFEEQIDADAMATFHHTESHADSFAEAGSYFPQSIDYGHGPDEYLEHIRRLKAKLAIPVIGSLNGVTPGGWTRYAESMEQAGADALELNLYHMPMRGERSADEIESQLLSTVADVRSRVTMPLAVKISPFFTAPAHFIRSLAGTGIQGVVLFNRFYQPDIDIEMLETMPRLQLSRSGELLLRLRWLASLHGRVDIDLAVTGGVHTHQDVIKAIMAGANCIQLVSSLLMYGPGHVNELLDKLREYMDEKEYQNMDEMRGCMSLRNCPDPAAFERGNYMQTLQGWKM